MFFPKLTPLTSQGCSKQSAPRMSPELWSCPRMSPELRAEQPLCSCPRTSPDLWSCPRTSPELWPSSRGDAAPGRTQVPGQAPSLQGSPWRQRPGAPGASLSRTRCQARVEAARTAELSLQLSPRPPVPPPVEKQTLHKRKRLYPSQGLTCDPPPPPRPRPRPLRARFYLPGVISRGCPGRCPLGRPGQ